MSRIKVAVVGAAGKMGIQVLKTIDEQDDMELVAAVDPNREGEDVGALMGTEPMHVKCLASVGTRARPRAGITRSAAAQRSAATSPSWLTIGAIALSESLAKRTVT